MSFYCALILYIQDPNIQLKKESHKLGLIESES